MDEGRIIEELGRLQKDIAAGGAMRIMMTLGGMATCTGIAILCLQDAPLGSINSIIPALMAFYGIGTIWFIFQR